MVAAVVILATASCERASRDAHRRDPATIVRLHLDTIGSLPKIHVAVPAFGAHWSELGGDSYWLRGGSLREGLLTNMYVGPLEQSCGTACAPEHLQVRELDGHAIRRCTRAGEVEVAIAYADHAICCTARWVTAGQVTAGHRRIAQAMESACRLGFDP
jgi:hypothetical protein